MGLPYNEARCTGQQCPSANNCRRYTERQIQKGIVAAIAPLYLRREAGADACDQYMPVVLVSTFDAETKVADSPAAANDIAQRVAMIVSEQACVDIKSVTNETLLVADLGMDSLDLIECTMAIEEAFGIEIDDAEDERCASVADVIAMVERKGGAA